MNAYRLLDLAAKNMDPEDLSIVVALSEGKAVTLRCAIMASYAEQNLIDRIVGNLSVVVWIQQPVKTPIKLLLFKFLKATRVYQVWTFALELIHITDRKSIFSPYLTVPSDTPGTDSVTSRGSWHCPLRILIIRRASTSLRGALTEAHPRYVSWLNTTLSSSGMGLPGLPSDDDSSAAVMRKDRQ